MNLKSIAFAFITTVSINAFSMGHNSPPQNPSDPCEPGYSYYCHNGHDIRCSCMKDYVSPCKEPDQEVRCHLNGQNYDCGCTDVHSFKIEQ